MPAVDILNPKTALGLSQPVKRLRGRPKQGKKPRVVLSAMSVSESTREQMDRWARDYSWKVKDCPPGVLQDLLVKFGQDRGFGLTLEKPERKLMKNNP
jgi:hypothetical protein